MNAKKTKWKRRAREFEEAPKRLLAEQEALARDPVGYWTAALESPKSAVRLQAAKQLAELKGLAESALPALLNHCGDYEVQVRTACLATLSKLLTCLEMPPPFLLPHLHSWLVSGDIAMATWAADALASYGGRAAFVVRALEREGFSEALTRVREGIVRTERPYLLGKAQGFLDAFGSINQSSSGEISLGKVFLLPDAETLDAACWKLVRSECDRSRHQSLRKCTITDASQGWRDALKEELVGRELPGGYLFHLFSYPGDAEHLAVGEHLLKLLEALFGGAPLRVCFATWENKRGNNCSPWCDVLYSEWVFETHTGSYLLVLAYSD